jgi:multicomponent Na+:H+ antiporter subunit F
MIMTVSGALMLGAIVLAGIRFFRGPTAADRTIAFDTLTIISISVIALLAARYGRVIFLDVALIYGILSFIGVIAIARYIERG